MSITTTIATGMKKFIGSKGTAIAAAAVTTGVVAYDSHIIAKSAAESERKRQVAISLRDEYLDNIAAGSNSPTLGWIKQALFRFSLNNSYKDYYGLVKGYIKEFASNVAHSAIPLGCAALAVISKPLRIPGLIGLGVSSALNIFKDSFTGKSNYLKD